MAAPCAAELGRSPARALAPRGSSPTARLVIDQGADRAGKRGAIRARHHQTGAAGNHVVPPWTAMVADDDRKAGGLRLEHRRPAGAAAAGEDQHVAGGIDAGQLLLGTEPRKLAG